MSAGINVFDTVSVYAARIYNRFERGAVYGTNANYLTPNSIILLIIAFFLLVVVFIALKYVLKD